MAFLPKMQHFGDSIPDAEMQLLLHGLPAVTYPALRAKPMSSAAALSCTNLPVPGYDLRGLTIRAPRPSYTFDYDSHFFEADEARRGSSFSPTCPSEDATPQTPYVRSSSCRLSEFAWEQIKTAGVPVCKARLVAANTVTRVVCSTSSGWLNSKRQSSTSFSSVHGPEHHLNAHGCHYKRSTSGPGSVGHYSDHRGTPLVIVPKPTTRSERAFRRSFQTSQVAASDCLAARASTTRFPPLTIAATFPLPPMPSTTSSFKRNSSLRCADTWPMPCASKIQIMTAAVA